MYLNLQIKRSLVLIFFLSSIEWRRQFQLTETFREFVRRVLDTIIDFLCEIYSVIRAAFHWRSIDPVYVWRFQCCLSCGVIGRVAGVASVVDRVWIRANTCREIRFFYFFQVLTATTHWNRVLISNTENVGTLRPFSAQ